MQHRSATQRWNVRAKNLLALLLAATVSLPPTAKADDLGDPAAGRDIATAWCANCHVFPGSNRATATGAPSFSAMADNRAMTPTTLQAFLRTNHNRMPDLHLSNLEIDDLVGFILSTRGK
jgi:mono/diheme cytochrome c family protein